MTWLAIAVLAAVDVGLALYFARLSWQWTVLLDRAARDGADVLSRSYRRNRAVCRLACALAGGVAVLSAWVAVAVWMMAVAP